MSNKELGKEPNLYYEFIDIARDFEGLASATVSDPDKLYSFKRRSLVLRTKALVRGDRYDIASQKEKEKLKNEP